MFRISPMEVQQLYANVEAYNKKTKETAKGWVSCGSYVFPYNALTLNKKQVW